MGENTFYGACGGRTKQKMYCHWQNASREQQSCDIL